MMINYAGEAEQELQWTCMEVWQHNFLGFHQKANICGYVCNHMPGGDERPRRWAESKGISTIYQGDRTSN